MISQKNLYSEILRLGVLLLIAAVPVAQAAQSFMIVAPSNASPKEKARANLVCDGVGDQVELTASFTGNKCGVEWLPGDYYLAGTVELVSALGSVIDAEGAYLHYQPVTGDAIHIQGAFDCRYRFGTVETNSTGAAIRAQNPPGVSILMNIITFTSLIGHNQNGTGLYIDVSQEGICTNRFEGISISGFDTGVFLGETQTKKTDTNWFFVNSIRRCNTCIRELRYGVDDSVWRVGVDTTLANSVGIRTNAFAGRFDVMMSNSGGVGTKALMLDSNAGQNVFEVLPPIDNFTVQDSSSPSSSNIILSAGKPPFYYIHPLVLGDFDGNNCVNILDLEILAQGWLGNHVIYNVWDIADDWSDSANPNGVWSYNNDNNVPITTHVNDWVNMHAGGQPAWASSNNDVPGWAKVDGDCSSWADMPIGCVVTHAAANGSSSVTWTSPIEGIIILSGNTWMPRDIDRQLDWEMTHNGAVFTGGRLVPIPAIVPIQTWNAGEEWIDGLNQSVNPNLPWTYRVGGNSSPVPYGDLLLWRGEGQWGSPPCYGPAMPPTEAPPIMAGGPWTILGGTAPGEVVGHGPWMVRWTSPVGTAANPACIKISGYLYQLLTGTTSIVEHWYLKKNGITLTDSAIPHNGTVPFEGSDYKSYFDNGSGGADAVYVQVVSGDTIDLVTSGDGGDQFCAGSFVIDQYECDTGQYQAEHVDLSEGFGGQKVLLRRVHVGDVISLRFSQVGTIATDFAGVDLTITQIDPRNLNVDDIINYEDFSIFGTVYLK